MTWFESLIECTLMMVTCKVVVVIIVYLFKDQQLWHLSYCDTKPEFVGFECYLNVSMHVFFLLPLLYAYFLTVLKMIETVGDKSTYVYTKRKSFFLYSSLLSICCFVQQREISFIKYLKCFSFTSPPHQSIFTRFSSKINLILLQYVLWLRCLFENLHW